MNISITFGPGCKAPANLNDNSSRARDLTPVEAYAVRNIARRANLSYSTAALVAELAGIAREGRRNG
jgi:hypothetical protein